MLLVEKNSVLVLFLGYLHCLGSGIFFALLSAALSVFYTFSIILTQFTSSADVLNSIFLPF